MKVLSRNVRGLGERKKRILVRDVLLWEKPDFLILQKTKKDRFPRKCIHSLWGGHSVEWACLESVGASGGILILWDGNLFKSVEVVKGVFSISTSF